MHQQKLSADLRLAVQLQSSKGQFALLLGSGISQPAKVLTGWAIQCDLVRKIAALNQFTSSDFKEIEQWYHSYFGKEPNYSDLLDSLTASRPERIQLLKKYFEPNDEELQRGEKAPTLAHRSIAKLISAGYIKVVVTTNFDRLLEKALEADGLSPVVVRSVQDLKTALPMQHNKCTIYKIHGDYLDASIRNTKTELEKYEPAWNKQLERIFSEYGLIVCGWSSSYDDALRALVMKPKSSHFGVHWIARGPISKEGAEVIEIRKAATIETAGADHFFSELADNVITIERLDNMEKKLTVAIAEEKATTLLADPNGLISLTKLIRNATELAFKQLSGLGDSSPDNEEQVSMLENAIEICLPLVVQTSYWGSAAHHNLVKSTVFRLAEAISATGNPSLSQYHTVLLLYAIGLTGTISGDYTLAKLVLWENRPTKGPIFEQISSQIKPLQRMLGGYGKFRLSERFRSLLRPLFLLAEPSDTNFEFACAKWEHLFGLVCFHESPFGNKSAPYGPHNVNKEQNSMVAAEIFGESKNKGGNNEALKLFRSMESNTLEGLIEEFTQYVTSDQSKFG